MELIHSAGAAMYTMIDGQRCWALVREKSGGVGLPKGHVEAGETVVQAALREVMEETGVQAILHRGVPPLVDTYRMADGRYKRVTYYLAHFEGDTLSPDPTQVEEAMLLPLDAALQTITHASARRVLRRAAREVEKLDQP